MTRSVYFITHSSLDYKHARLCLMSLASQNFDDLWDNLFVYNTHQEELPNSDLFSLIEQLGIQRKFRNVQEVAYDPSSRKTNLQDFMNLIDHCRAHVPLISNSYLLYLKSDYILSSNFFDGLKKFDCESNFIFSAMIENAKEFVEEKELFERASRDSFTLVDDVTYYAGSDFRDDHPHSGGPPEQNTVTSYRLLEHWNKHKGWFDSGGYDRMKRGPDGVLSPIDPKIRFVSHACRGDVNVHYMDAATFAHVSSDGSAHHTWGYWQGWNKLIESGTKVLNTPESFAIHVFHDIVSKNRAEPRNDPNKIVPGQRY